MKKYGFSPGTPVIAFTGDNPSSLVGMGASRPGTAVISLGTSDTVFAAMAAPRTDPRGYGHVFGNPAGGFMALACFANGSLAREEIAHRFGLDWDAFADAILTRTRPGNAGNLLLPYFVPEITPRLPVPVVRWFGSDAFVSGREPHAAARAVVETQALSLRLHSRWIGEDMDPILVTGGASRNRGILARAGRRVPGAHRAVAGVQLLGAGRGAARSPGRRRNCVGETGPPLLRPGRSPCRESRPCHPNGV